MRPQVAVLWLLAPRGLVFVFLLLAGGNPRSFCEGAEALNISRSQMWKFRCKECDSQFCEWPNECRQSGGDSGVGCCEAYIVHDVLPSNGDDSCDDDRYCTYYGKGVCVAGGNFIETCVYNDTASGTVKCCVDFRTEPTKDPIEMTTAVVTKAKTTSSQKPVAVTTKTSTAAATTPPPGVEPTQPSAQTNVPAIVLGSVLSVVLLLVLAGIFVLWWTNRLSCGRRAGDSAGVSVEMHRNDDEWHADLQSQKPGGNVYQPDHYYSQIRDEGGNPGKGRNGHAHDDHRSTPSAPPTETDGATEAQADHQYFVLEPEPAATERPRSEQAVEPEPDGTDEAPNDHDYFVLEKDDTENSRDVEENVPVPKEGTPHTTSTPGARGETTPYDHIKRSEAPRETGDYTPLNFNPGYDHLERVGLKLPREGAVHDEDKSYSKLEPQNENYVA